MNKLGFIVEMNRCKTSAQLRRWVEFAAANGIDGIELMYNEETHDVFDAAIVEEAFRGLPVEVCAVGYWRRNTLDPCIAEREKTLEITKGFIDGAARLGCRNAYFNAGEFAEGDDEANIAELKKVYPILHAYAAERGVQVSCYVGHGGNFIKSRATLSRVLQEIPQFNLKLDPVGIIRNLHDDPYEIVKLFGGRLAHFHVKDILRYGDDGFEAEPAVGQGDLKWNIIFALLYHHGYDGYVVIEPHGPLYSKDENRWKHIVLSMRHVRQFMV